jgi:uncharacterized protein
VEISGEYTFDAPQDIVWETLQNPLIYGAVVSTCLGVEKVADNEYTGILQFKLGSMQGSFKGKVHLSNLNPPVSYDIQIHGNGLLGVADVQGSLKVEPVENKTLIHYQGKAQFGGRIASVGSRMLENAVNTLLGESLDALDKYLQVEMKKHYSKHSVPEEPIIPPPTIQKPKRRRKPKAG